MGDAQRGHFGAVLKTQLMIRWNMDFFFPFIDCVKYVEQQD